jgi:hypothetical protein
MLARHEVLVLAKVPPPPAVRRTPEAGVVSSWKVTVN